MTARLVIAALLLLLVVMAGAPSRAQASHTTDANLSGLTISPGTLSPDFAATTTAYSASVASSVVSVTVTPHGQRRRGNHHRQRYSGHQRQRQRRYQPERRQQHHHHRRQPPRTATPRKTYTITVTVTDLKLEITPGQIPSLSKYPKLDSILNDLLEDHEERQFSAPRRRQAGAAAPTGFGGSDHLLRGERQQPGQIPESQRRGRQEHRRGLHRGLRAGGAAGAAVPAAGVIQVQAIIPALRGQQTPAYDQCENSLGDLTDSMILIIEGAREATCASENRAGRYARYYSFTVSRGSSLTVDLVSPDLGGFPEVDTYLYLLSGSSKTGDIITENDDREPTINNSRISFPVVPGAYTLEATTWQPNQTGDFTITIDVAPYTPIVGQGAGVHGSPAWNALGITGEGIKVGILDEFRSFPLLMGTELPSAARVTARCYTDMGVFTADISDCDVDSVHGTAVAEAVTDIAPGVELYISDPPSKGDLKNATEWMVAQGVDVINYSSTWTWDGPGDGTSPFTDSPLKTVDAAVTGGVIWVNSAGNAGQQVWLGDYEDSDSDGLIEFAPGDEVNNVTLTENRQFIAQMRWDDNWGTPSRDLALLLFYDSNGGWFLGYHRARRWQRC